MLPVEILPVQETIVLRARGSELLILPHHVQKLKGMEKPRDFSQYFRDEALVNRPARKLFEAWLRKDHTLWPRLYQTVHKEMDVKADGEDAGATEAAVKPAAAKKADKAEKAEEKKADKADKAEKAEKKADKADKAEKADDKKTKKADKADKAEKAEKKADKADKAEKAEKKPAKKAEKAEKKTEAKSTEKKAAASKKKG